MKSITAFKSAGVTLNEFSNRFGVFDNKQTAEAKMQKN